jgi:hypothetical protein
MSALLHLGKGGTETLDSLHEGLQVISFDWRYIYVNATAVKQSKFKTKEELLGFSMKEKYPDIEKTALFDILKTCMILRKPEHFLNEFIFPGGVKGWFELRIEPVPAGICILSMDISKRMRAEEDTQKYIHGLEKMLFLTSHRVRQPIVNLQGVSNLLKSDVITHDDLNKIAGYMKDSIEALNFVTKELTEFIADMKSISK